MFKVEAVKRLVAKIQCRNELGETDDMALVGILSAQLVHRLFVEDFHHAPPLSDAENVKVVDLRPHAVVEQAGVK
jgi:hypothetical protein